VVLVPPESGADPLEKDDLLIRLHVVFESFYLERELVGILLWADLPLLVKEYGLEYKLDCLIHPRFHCEDKGLTRRPAKS